MKKEVLEKRRRILGEEYPDTMSAMNNLAITLGDRGQLNEAAKLMKEVLEKMKQILGEQHPKTKVAAQNLATLVRRQKVHGIVTMIFIVLTCLATFRALDRLSVWRVIRGVLAERS